MRYVPELVGRIAQYQSIVIYGAGIVASEVAGILMGQPYNFRIDCFVVTDIKQNPEMLKGLRVYGIDDVYKDMQDSLFIIASMEKNLNEIMEGLHRRGCFNVLPMTFESDIWGEIRGNAYIEVFQKTFGKKYMDISTLIAEKKSRYSSGNINVYRAVSHLDKKLYENMNMFSWEIPIQVGIKLAEMSLCELNDALGDDNISAKNSRFCELTALYWIWKNDKSQYKGLCHYRRHFVLDKQQRDMITKSKIDVVLTTPIYNDPDVYSVYVSDHVRNDWMVMSDVLTRLHPEYTTVLKELEKAKWYYGYNMFIARDDIFNDYCSFLFPILFECEKIIGNRKDSYQGRYIGFLSERLMSLYFMAHKEMNIVHCRKHFISY